MGQLNKKIHVDIAVLKPAYLTSLTVIVKYNNYYYYIGRR